MARGLFAILALACAAGCTSHGDAGGEAHQAAKAAHDFVAFAHGGGAPEPKGTPLPNPPEVVVSARRIVDGDSKRPRVDLSVALPVETTHDAVAAVLEAAARGPDARGYVAVRVRAFPAHLRHLVGPYGILILAADGRGWDGTGKTDRYQEIARKLGTEIPVTELRLLVAVDHAVAGGASLDAAIARVARARHQHPSAVRGALDRARRAYPSCSPPCR